MAKFFHRILLGALTSALLLPLAGQAQQQDQSPSGQPQNSSQPNGTQRRGRMAGGQHMAMLAEKLHLTDAQKEQFQQIGKDMRRQGMAIRQDSSLTPDQKKEKMLALRKQAHQQMFAVLTPEQKDQLKQMREQHKKEQGKDKPAGDQAAAKSNTGSATAEDDDPFAGMTNDEDDGRGSL
jgi:Spy/CpxP family protein refolding chaperone